MAMNEHQRPSGLFVSGSGASFQTSSTSNEVSSFASSGPRMHGRAIPNGEAGYTVPIQDVMNNYAEPLRENYAQCKKELESLRLRVDQLEESKALETQIETKLNRILDMSFWAVVFICGFTSLLILALIAYAVFSESAIAWLMWFVGFIGFGGAVAILVYLRKLGRLNERVEALESKAGF